MEMCLFILFRFRAMSAKQVSVLAQYDDLCRGFNYFINSSEKGFV